ncbi:MAG TPA: hypothetical protein VHW68_03685 [Actinomycetota bacterium]|nr:hypothetical protein [Actinomycetota bacterium]
MLRQLWRLTRPVPAAGPNALAVTIYEHPDGVVHAEESGFEGVACVDDAARLLIVLVQVWAATKLDWVERWARGVLDFVLWMQEPDGTWLNFIHDWDGDKNREGITSRAGQNFWLARGVLGTQWAAFVFGEEHAREACRTGLVAAAAEEAPPDIRALHLFAALFGDDAEPFLAERWAEELLACRDGDVLKNAELEVGVPHLWAHVQEGALAEAAGKLDRPDYLDAAIASAERVIVPAVTSAFGGRESTSPYDVAAAVWSLDRLATATGDARWARLAADGRAWFDGRNTAGAAVYDRERGRVADGIDGTRVSDNSGAESNIVAAEVLLDLAIEVARSMPDPFAS